MNWKVLRNNPTRPPSLQISAAGSGATCTSDQLTTHWRVSTPTHRSHWGLLHSRSRLLQAKDTNEIQEKEETPKVESGSITIPASRWTMGTEQHHPGKLTQSFGVQGFCKGSIQSCLNVWPVFPSPSLFLWLLQRLKLTWLFPQSPHHKSYC